MSTVGLESKLTMVWRSLVDGQVTKIGIHGIGGVGKTTLLKQIYKKLTNSSHHFDTVIWVTVSQNMSVNTVQDDIWKRIGVLNVEWVNKSFEEKAKAIDEVLSGKTFVLLLDDLGQKLDLTEIGVPDLKENKCKLIFTTRRLDLCSEMGAEKAIPMFALEWEHAWELFKNKVGEDRLTDPKIVDLAQTMASTCKGLPMLLCTVARAMATMKTYEEWLDAIKGVHFDVAEEGGKEYVFTLLRLCFDCLDRVRRSCLLYFCTFPEDFTILKNELIDFWICEQLLSHHDFEVDVLNLGYKTVDALIGACLFEEEEVNCVKLLDLIRDFALENMFLYDDILHQISGSKEVGRVLAMRNMMQDLETYHVPNKFLTFLLNHNPFIIVKAEFVAGSDGMSPQNSGPLIPVDVSLENKVVSRDESTSSSRRFSVRNIASSISKFVMRKKKTRSKFDHFDDFYQPLSTQKIGTFHQFIDALAVLDLSNSGVEKIPPEIAELVSLEHLNLSQTWIDHLPIEMINLVKLKCLNLEYNEQLRLIPKQLIFELSHLQILKMFRCGFSAEEVDDNILSVRGMDIEPLFVLQDLKVLSITITCASALYKFVSSQKFLCCTQSLSLEVFWGSQSLDISPLAAMENLLLLEIHQFEDLKELNCYPNHLDLARERSFGKLREIKFDRCSSLVEITWVLLVPNLVILKVNDCEEMKEIISNGRIGEMCNGDNLEPFVQLEILTLENLPELRSIYWNTLPFQNLKKIEVIDCSQLKKLPLSTANEAMVIKGQEDWWKNIEWENDDSRIAFSPLFRPTV